MEMTFTSIKENQPGLKWKTQWNRAWPIYRHWFTRPRSNAPPRSDCESAMTRYMPELAVPFRRLLALTGGADLEACFLSHWCPPQYLSGCSIAAAARTDQVRLVRNYDLAPHLNEGLLFRSAWGGVPVMGMVEFLWGLSDGINNYGLSAALAFGGRNDTAPGFGITLILRYVLETCRNVEEAIDVLNRVPSHMAYNIALADRFGHTASVELRPGGGLLRVWPSIATNHQHGPEPASRHRFTETYSRRAHLQNIIADAQAPRDLARHFLQSPLYQSDYKNGFGTLFTAEYDPLRTVLTLHWPSDRWVNSLDIFTERQIVVPFHDTHCRNSASGSEPKAIKETGWIAESDSWLTGQSWARYVNCWAP